jgi:hypothetical protein
MRHHPVDTKRWGSASGGGPSGTHAEHNFCLVARSIRYLILIHWVICCHPQTTSDNSYVLSNTHLAFYSSSQQPHTFNFPPGGMNLWMQHGRKQSAATPSAPPASPRTYRTAARWRRCSRSRRMSRRRPPHPMTAPATPSPWTRSCASVSRSDLKPLVFRTSLSRGQE